MKSKLSNQKINYQIDLFNYLMNIKLIYLMHF